MAGEDAAALANISNVTDCSACLDLNAAWQANGTG
jgi:hypothetical protein